MTPDAPGDDQQSTTSEIELDGGPRLELDQLLRQLIDRAEDVMHVQSRLRGLLSANTMIVADLELPVVLRRIVQAACRLVDARYGALGVLTPGGGLAEFVSVGIDEATARRISALPSGKGLLRALIDDPQPIRLRNLADDARSVGVPAELPPMHSFLGVPIRVRDEVFGNLYLTEAARGEFTAEDEELVTALAATAGVAIENARLFAQAKLRQDWLQASTQITRQLLTDEGEDPLDLIARQARQMADADLVTVVLPTRGGTRLMVEVASGRHAEGLAGYSYPVADTYAGQAFASGRPVLVRDVAEHDDVHVHLSKVLTVGPLMVLPLVGAQRLRGALVVGRERGRLAFDEADLDMANTFANHAALALELADARSDQQRMLLLEERDRIARDLHDHVIQQLFATGLTVQSVLAAQSDDALADRLSGVVSDIDETIRRIRTTIFQLRGQIGPQTDTVRSRILMVVSQMAPLLGFDPSVEFAGPVDAVVAEPIADDLVAVIREALTNVAKHADATQARVALTATSERLTLEIVDDGVGFDGSTRRSGIANLEERARRHGGTLTISPAEQLRSSPERKGAHLSWTISLA